MRLTLALLKRKMPNGHIWTGKHRLAHHIYPLNIERMVKRLQIEEKNLSLLRKPYLTLDQEHGHTKVWDKKGEWMYEMKLLAASSRMRPSVRIEDKFKHLAHCESWDC